MLTLSKDSDYDYGTDQLSFRSYMASYWSTEPVLFIALYLQGWLLAGSYLNSYQSIFSKPAICLYIHGQLPEFILNVSYQSLSAGPVTTVYLPGHWSFYIGKTYIYRANYQSNAEKNLLYKLI